MLSIETVRTEMRDKCLLALDFYLLGDMTIEEFNRCVERYSDACDTLIEVFNHKGEEEDISG
jgi:hypothetical protein